MSPTDATRFEVFGLPGIGEVTDRTDLVELVADASARSVPLADGDIVVVTSKIVSKAEGRVLAGVDRDEAIDAELVRTVSEWTTPRGRTRIVQTRHGFVMAAAGVDASNVERGKIVLLPLDPDASARALRDGLRERHGVHVGVVITDTAGRVWRDAVVDFAIGAAGVIVADDFRGHTDAYGNELGITVVAVADELAAASELVRGKLSAMPVAVVRGLPHLLLPPAAADRGASVLIRPSTEDRFRLGTPEAMREAVYARHTARSFTADVPDPAAIQRALAAALSAPSPPVGIRWRFVLVESAAARQAFTEKLGEAGAGLSDARYIVIPCALSRDDSTLLALGAAVENLLITLGADGLASAWLFPEAEAQALTGAQAAVSALDLPSGWIPMGAIAIGKAARPGEATELGNGPELGKDTEPEPPPTRHDVPDIANVTVTR